MYERLATLRVRPSVSAGDHETTRIRRELERREEHPGHFPGHQLTPGLRCLFLDICAFCERRTPEQDVTAAVLRVCHAAADRFEDFGASQLGNQQAEPVPV